MTKISINKHYYMTQVTMQMNSFDGIIFAYFYIIYLNSCHVTSFSGQRSRVPVVGYLNHGKVALTKLNHDACKDIFIFHNRFPRDIWVFSSSRRLPKFVTTSEGVSYWHKYSGDCVKQDHSFCILNACVTCSSCVCTKCVIKRVDLRYSRLS